MFIRSGIRFDYLMADPDDTFFKELVEYHVSGQLKVAPEHCAPNTLAYMGKPPIETFNKFKDKFYELSKKAGKKQYLVPYLMSSHPGSTLKDAVYLAEYLYKNHMRPEQVQDFYPTPGTVSTCMFYTGLDPYTLKPVFVEKTAEGKALQRALLQYYEPRNAEKVIKALKMTHREDLIPLLVPAEGRIAVQRSARSAEAADVPIHSDGTCLTRDGRQGWTNYDGYSNIHFRPGIWYVMPVQSFDHIQFVGGMLNGSLVKTHALYRGVMEDIYNTYTPAPSGGSYPYTDVAESRWSYSYIKEMYDAGVINGMPDGSFQPYATATREQACIVLCAL